MADVSDLIGDLQRTSADLWTVNFSSDLEEVSDFAGDALQVIEVILKSADRKGSLTKHEIADTILSMEFPLRKG